MRLKPARVGFMLAWALTSSCTGAFASTVPGDVNGSGGVDAVDVQLVVNAALGIGSSPACDINSDGAVNAVDVQLVINAALGINISVPPTITSFAINSGAAETTSRTVTLNNTSTGAPTQYMASENSGFAGAGWQTYSTAPSFDLSSGNGTKTVYFKVKNADGESLISNDTITLNELAAGTEETILLPGLASGVVQLVMVWCPPGTFMMGRSPGEQGSNSSEDPQHQVTLSHGFWIGKYPLTQAQWMAVMGSNPSFFSGYDNRPVESVSRDATQAFITALNAATGRTFRLPSEAEWEYACRAGTTTRFYWGDDPGYTDIGAYAWYFNNSAFTTHDVGGKAPNAWGLYDMGGNVSEYCRDWYGSYSRAVTDPAGPSSGVWGVSRGGCFGSMGLSCRSASRSTDSPGAVSNGSYAGFRLVSASRPGPTVTSFLINSGAAAAASRTVTLDNTCAKTPTQYMASEDSGFAGAGWQTYGAAPSFDLSSGNGIKTVYLKVKNAGGESEVSSDTITLNEITLSEISAGTEETILIPGLASGYVRLDMVWCPAGTFMMGAYPGEQDSDPVEDPQHQVTLTQGFWMAKYPVTQAQWQAVMGSNPSFFLGYDNRPVERTSRDGTQAFITALNATTGRTFRLPSEAEWEYACRAGTRTRFYWGDDPSYADISNYAWWSSNSGNQTHDVGGKLPNAWGLYDMGGNVYEYCQDWYGSYSSGAVTDPAGPSSGSNGISRGGGFSSPGSDCRSAGRLADSPGSASNGIYTGFRLARTSSAAPTVASFLINRGAAEVMSHTVTLDNTCTTPPTHYMASENPDFFGASWQTYSNAPSFDLSSGNGTKTVYLKVKNADGESGRTSDTIAVNELTILLPQALSDTPVPLVMVWCPAGTFMMGAYPGEQDSVGNEVPQHQVTLTHGFWMGKYEVTQQQWAAIMVGNPSYFSGNPNRPVESVSRDTTQAFITMLKAVTGRTFRLPSEAEWEYAYRAGTTTRFYWDDDPGYSRVGENAWFYANIATITHNVGFLFPNAWGLCDMSGNVWEYCQDWYGSYSSGAVIDPVGPASGVYGVSRGGCFSSYGVACRSASRINDLPGSITNGNYTGLRLASSSTSGPTVTSFQISSGAAEVTSRTVTLNNTCTDLPGQYMASEDSGFAGASWRTYSTAPSFSLSSGNGTKTVYFKVYNAEGESAVSSDTITLSEIPAGTEQTVLLPGAVPLVMLWCPPGTFMMGRLPGEQDSFPTEDALHQVTLTQGFWVGKYEVTQAQWVAVTGSNPSHFTGDNRPVEQVSWNGAQAFITALNAYTGKTFRLPSEAEWEYACRAGTTTRFYWGDDASYAQIGGYAWYSDNSGATTHDVGGKLPNAWGLYDMSGNVFEWCQDWWFGSYPSGAVIDPTGASSGSNRVVRGGSWYFSNGNARSASHRLSGPDATSDRVGFRLAK
ncbi:MAG: SUMF1/EgtB/PvdO family nonheme iron enzyme [Candidatus Hydrogenedentes bacterium]|nr:SUMF1/EgtB/PvdO family nonheme iron enzyme [Candidatus Hydrogenedentota bacterium]